MYKRTKVCGFCALLFAILIIIYDVNITDSYRFSATCAQISQQAHTLLLCTPIMDESSPFLRFTS